MHKQNGTTLIETTIAITIFLASLTALLAVLLDSKSAPARTNSMFLAHNICANHIENLRSKAFGDLPFAAETSTRVNGDGAADGSGAFYRTTVVNANYLGNASLAEVVISVSYADSALQSASPVVIRTVIYGT